jgi:hypothetical protein
MQKDAATVQESVNFTFTTSAWIDKYRKKSLNTTAAEDRLP